MTDASKGSAVQRLDASDKSDPRKRPIQDANQSTARADVEAAQVAQRQLAGSTAGHVSGAIEPQGSGHNFMSDVRERLGNDEAFQPFKVRRQSFELEG